MRILALLALAAMLAGTSGCGRNKSVIEPPAELIEFEQSLTVRRLWSHKLGGGTERLRLGLNPATDGARVYAGSFGGNVVAIDAVTGREVWSVDTDLALAAGPGLGSGILVFGTNNGDLIALEMETGEERWRINVGSEVLSSPAIGSNIVVFRTVDGRLRGVSATDASEIWATGQALPPLTLRGNSTPRVTGDVVVSGFDNGRVGAYNLSDGNARWELAIATPAGRTELDRLVDISTGLQIVGNDVYVSSYHGRAVGIDLVTGLVFWTQDLSSFAGLGVDGNFVYVTNDVGGVMALDRRNGNIIWTQEALRLRDVTAPTRFGRSVVVGDFEGYLHWLDPVDGRFLARARGASSRISGPPIVVGVNIFVQGDDGTIAAFEVVDEAA